MDHVTIKIPRNMPPVTEGRKTTREEDLLAWTSQYECAENIYIQTCISSRRITHSYAYLCNADIFNDRKSSNIY